MKVVFPSREFDEAVAAVCHGAASEEQMRVLNDLLRQHAAARDEYILRLELHSRLASEPDLFALALDRMDEPLSQSEGARASARFNVHQIKVRENSGAFRVGELKRRERRVPAARIAVSVVALAACLAVLAVGLWNLGRWRSAERKGTTSEAVAMLNRAVDAQWSQDRAIPRVGAPLEPGWLRLESGLAQVVFYSGARVVIEGPTELQIVSQSEASCRSGRLTAEVPPQASGFRIGTPQMKVTDLGTSFGLEVKDRRAEVHVFNGTVELQPSAGKARQTLQEGAGIVMEGSHPARLIAANPAAFASLFELRSRSVAADAQRYNQWRDTCRGLNRDPSLLVHFDFENIAPPDWRLRNVGDRNAGSDATIVGCQWTEGRWTDKRALEFQSVSDRVRLSVPGEFEALTLAAWVRVRGLDRQFNSLFMCDGFDPGTVHWLIRNDGVLSLGLKGPKSGNFQIFASPPVLTLDRLGLWVHLAVVLDGRAKRAVHYVNGLAVSEKALRLNPPFRVGAAELGNWNATGFRGKDPSLIRSFSGAMDEFCLFSRALNAEEIRALCADGKPQPDLLARR